jgi:DNA polymerase-3 subunit chi
MTQVSFYTLKDDAAESRLKLACRLTEKALTLGHRVFIHTESTEQARLMDDLLWQFKPSSFIPHSLRHKDDSVDELVLLGVELPSAQNQDVLINLTADACHAHQQFSRINEIVSSDEESLARGRDCYRFYQSVGYQPETHKL